MGCAISREQELQAGSEAAQSHAARRRGRSSPRERAEKLFDGLVVELDRYVRIAIELRG